MPVRKRRLVCNNTGVGDVHNLRYLRAVLAVAVVLLVSLLILTAAFADSAVPTRAGRQYLEVLQPDGSYMPLYVKGMNLSVALPGKHPSEFPMDKDLYRRWLGQIAGMNCNTVRVYTILPPPFYEALYEYNKAHKLAPLWLIQGVWATPPPEYNYFDEAYMAEVELNLRNAVNLVHGNANFDDRPGWTGGRYRADVSPWLLAWLLGREWEPDDIEGFHALRPDHTSYKGTMISCDGQPIECWFAQLCDYCVSYEDEHYDVQHPTTFSSWPPTDPLNHTSESNLEDEAEVAGYISQGRVDVFSNDSVNLSSRSLYAEPGFDAGLYASYHVYPYWPDFIDNELKYKEAQDRYGTSSYFGYLSALKAFYDDRPLLIAEYGLPNGPMPCHMQSQGWNHGGLSEEEVASSMARLTEAVYDTGCAGGGVFSWMDEWFKKVWLWADMYDPWMDRRLWYNSYDPEENYGMLAILPGAGGPTCTLSGAEAEWEAVEPRPGTPAALADGAPSIEEVKLMHDEGFLYARIKFKDFDDWEFEEHGLYIGLDVLGDLRGNLSWPGPLRLASDRGLEEVITIAAGQARIAQTESFRFWEPYRTAYSTEARIAEVQPHILAEEDNRWLWFEPRVETNRRRVGRDGQVYPNKTWKLNPLPHGSLVPGEHYNSHAVWNATPGSGVVELRLPWILLGVVGPHQMRVLQADEEGVNSSEVTEGIGISCALSTATGQLASTWPASVDSVVTTSAAERYAWPEWEPEDITYHFRLKPVYYAMQELLTRLAPGSTFVQPGTPDLE